MSRHASEGGDERGATAINVEEGDEDGVVAAPRAATERAARHGGATGMLGFSSRGVAAQPAIAFDNTKAGLQAVDKARTEAVIKELSEGSSFYANEQRKIRLRQGRLQKLMEKAKVYDTVVRPDPHLYAQVVARVARYERVFEARRRLDRIHVHMDMDMFYAAVEQKKNPSLRDVPFGVGSYQMLSTTNYIARQYGVRSGMAGFVGKKLCPQLVIVPTDFTTYKREAERVRAIAADYDPRFHSYGLDELSMEMSGYLARHCPTATTVEARYDAVEDAIRECRRRVQAMTGLTASAGVAPTATLAKIASNYEKPNGQHTLRLPSREAVMQFVATLPVRRIPGIGQSQEFILGGLGVRTMGKLYAQRHRLAYAMTEKTFCFLLAAALGVDEDGDGEDGGQGEDTTRRQRANTESDDDDNDDDTAGQRARGAESSDDDDNAEEGAESWRKSIGQERTFACLGSGAELRQIALDTLHTAHERMLRKGLRCERVVLKTKQRNFRVHQFSHAVAPASDELPVLQRVVDELVLPLLDRFAEYRLLGVRLDKLSRIADASPPQRTLRDYFVDPPSPQPRRKRERDAEVVVDLTHEDTDDASEVVVLSPSPSGDTSSAPQS